MSAVPQKITRSLRVPGRKKNAENVRRAAEARERALAAMDLRKAGVTYAQIATAIGFSSAGNAKRSIDRLMLNQVKDASIDIIEMDLARMDEYVSRCTNALRSNGDLSQIDRLLRIQDAKYRLLGISDESLRTVREQHGVTANVDINNVMIVQQSQTSEADFIKKMMAAVNISPETNRDAADYIESHVVKEISSGLPKKIVRKKVVRKKKSTSKPLGEVMSNGYAPIIEGEIVDDDIPDPYIHT